MDIYYFVNRREWSKKSQGWGKRENFRREVSCRVGNAAPKDNGLLKRNTVSGVGYSRMNC